MSRTDTLAELERLKASLDVVVSRIADEIGLERLDANTMKRIFGFIGECYPMRDGTDTFPKDVWHHDVGYALMKRGVLAEMGGNPQNVRLVDGVMGWFYQTPGEYHDKEMNRILDAYVGEFGIESLNIGFPLITSIFAYFWSTASRDDVKAAAEEADYQTLFLQSDRTIDGLRRMQIQERFPDFRVPFWWQLKVEEFFPDYEPNQGWGFFVDPLIPICPYGRPTGSQD